jgi:hypothetical protein
LSEVRRVLRPGGVYVFRTPNRWHYVAMTARLTPHWVHRLVANRLRGLPPDTHEPYPTFYAMNSRPALESAACEAEFAIRELRLIEKEPSYGMLARPLFFAFMAYERVVNSNPRFERFRANLLGVFEKPPLT